MKSSPTPCHLILCRNRTATSFAKDDLVYQVFESTLLDTLPRNPDGSVTVVPHLYDLKDDGAALTHLRTLAGSLMVLSWLPARAACWRLRSGGLRGDMIPVERDGSEPVSSRAPRSDDVPSDASRKIWCLDLHEYARPEACVATVRRILSHAAVGDTKSDQPVDVEHIDETTSPRWYPVIDQDRCVNCLECLNFCLFGVFGLDATEAILVEQPDACRPGCPACARVCPAGAIMFPEHADPAISGRAEKPAEGPTSDGKGLLPMLDPLGQAMAERNTAREKRADLAAESRPAETRRSDAHSGLDDLVDELDDLDL